MSFLMETLDYWTGEVGDLHKNCRELWTAAMTKRILLLDYIKISLFLVWLCWKPFVQKQQILIPQQSLDAKSGAWPWRWDPLCPRSLCPASGLWDQLHTTVERRAVAAQSRLELAPQSWCRAVHFVTKRCLCSCCTGLRRAVSPVHTVGAEHSTAKSKGACPQCSCRVLHNSVESCCSSAQRTS